MKIALTFDIDFSDYFSFQHLDEMELFFEFFKKLPWSTEIAATWFVRIDSQIEQLYGHSAFIIEKHEDKFDWLVSRGHEIAWHHHAYALDSGQWRPNQNQEVINQEIEHYGQIARRWGMNSTRMGWGYQTNESIRILNKLGFRCDSSAIPRPKYAWDFLQRDWSITPNRPFQPSKHDYRVSGKDTYDIWEIPITTAEIPAEGDTERVRRYINPAYRPEVFAQAINNLVELESCVLICHPYEIFHNENKHSLLAFNEKSFCDNIMYLLQNENHSFFTIGDSSLLV